VRVTVGEPIAPTERPNRQQVDALTAQTWAALHEMVRDEPQRSRPGPVGRWLTEAFNEWPEGDRRVPEAAAQAAHAAVGAAFATLSPGVRRP
jgi:hypothetical protein